MACIIVLCRRVFFHNMTRRRANGGAAVDPAGTVLITRPSENRILGRGGGGDTSKIKFAHSRPEAVCVGGRRWSGRKPVSEIVRWKNESKMCVVDFRSVSYFNFARLALAQPSAAAGSEFLRRRRRPTGPDARASAPATTTTTADTAAATQPWTWSPGAFHEIRSDRAAVYLHQSIVRPTYGSAFNHSSCTRLDRYRLVGTARLPPQLRNDAVFV